MELGEDDIIAAGAGDGLAHPVIDLRTAGQGENGVGHLPVDVLDVLVIEQHAVGGDGEAEVLPMLFFQRTGIVHRGLHRVHGHERLAAEEVHLDVPPGARALDHKVDGLFCRLHIHGHAVAGAEVACGGKAVFAAQIAVVGHMQAQGLDGRVLLHQRSRRRIDVVIV